MNVHTPIYNAVILGTITGSAYKAKFYHVQHNESNIYLGFHVRTHRMQQGTSYKPTKFVALRFNVSKSSKLTHKDMTLNGHIVIYLKLETAPQVEKKK